MLASWVRTVCAKSIACTRDVGICNPLHVRPRSVGGEFPVFAGTRFVHDRSTDALVR